MPKYRLAALPVIFLLSQAPAGAWSANTHICTAGLIRDDVIDDGKVEVWEILHHPDGTVSRNKLGDVPVPPDLVAAIRDFEKEFHAGSCSADAYPDMYIGQSVIHPFIPGQPWRATDWARHVLKCAREFGDEGSEERKKALAFAAGWLVHYAGDAFGHTHVNHYAGGAWDWGDMNIVLKHVAYESYINSKIPGHADETLRRLDMNAVFIRDCLMLHEDVQPALADVSYMKALINYYQAFADAVEKIEDLEEDLGGNLLGDWGDDLVGGLTGLDIAQAFCEQQRDNASRALMEWGETSTRVIRDITERNPVAAVQAVKEWISAWSPHLLLGIPNGVEEVVDYLGAPIGWITDPLKDLMEQTMVYLWEHVIRSTFEQIVNPEEFMRQMYGEAVMAEVDELMGITPDHPDLDPEKFAPFHDTVVLGKLALLDEGGINALSQLLGVNIPVHGSDDNLLWDCIESLDASNQLFLFPKFRLVETPELEQQAYRRLFLTPPYKQARSAIDPAHLLLWPLPPGGGLAFGTPVPDPLHDRSRVVGYILQPGQGQGEWQRVPFYEAGIPTFGVPQGYTGPVWGQWKPTQEGPFFFHLATAQTVEGSADLAEDEGIDIKIVAVPPGTQSYPSPSGMPNLPAMPDPQQMQGAMQQMLQSVQELMAQPGFMENLPPEARAALQEALAQMPTALAQGQGAPPPTEGEGTDSSLENAFIYPPELLHNLVEAWTEMAGNTGTGSGQAGDEEDQDLGRPGIGTVQDAAGNPVSGATVTLLERPLFEQLRRATGIPYLLLDQWMLNGYLMGRTNAEGQYLVMGVKEKEYVMIASAPRLPKTEMELTVTYGATHGVILPPIRLTGAGTGGTTASDPAGFGQHHPTPDFSLQVSDPVVSYDKAHPDGSVEVTLKLRPRGSFAGSVDLSVENLPEGVTAQFAENPVRLDRAKQVSVLFRGASRTSGTTTSRIRATSGEVSHEAPLVVALSEGQLFIPPEAVALGPGETALVRLNWRAPAGSGRGAAVRLGELPPGLTVKAKRLRSHRRVAQADLPNLTPQGLVQVGKELRMEAKVPQPATPPSIPQAQLDRVPDLLPTAGILLATNGWVEFALTAAPDLAPGSYSIPVVCKRGNVTTEHRIKVQVGP